MKTILIIGGTRNMGYFTTQRMLRAGYQVTLLNRGQTPDDFPESLSRLRADRTNPQQMKRALLARQFDAVIDFALYKETEAQMVVELLQDRVGHYLFISSGQVYLVREDAERPFRESDYAGRLIPAPKPATYAYEEWTYGMDKRSAEDVFVNAPAFPATRLRLPMVNSERDQMRRLYQYMLRLKDGGPILIPATPNLPLRHIYGLDAVGAIAKLVSEGTGKGDAINISQDETVSLAEFLTLLAEVMEVGAPKLCIVRQSELEAAGFLPDCSPFSERWMSELDNTHSKTTYGISYTPLAEALTNIVQFYREHPPVTPSSYKRRHAEIEFARQHPDG